MTAYEEARRNSWRATTRPQQLGIRNHAMNARVNRRRIRVEFGDCDPEQMGYYPNLVVWGDHSTPHLFETLGFPVRDLQVNRGIQIPVVGLNVRFLSPATWGDKIDIDSHV